MRYQANAPTSAKRYVSTPTRASSTLNPAARTCATASGSHEAVGGGDGRPSHAEAIVEVAVVDLLRQEDAARREHARDFSRDERLVPVHDEVEGAGAVRQTPARLRDELFVVVERAFVLHHAPADRSQRARRERDVRRPRFRRDGQRRVQRERGQPLAAARSHVEQIG